MATCFHCGEAIAGRQFGGLVGREARWFCCPGCAAASDLIRELGLEAYYRFRTEKADRVSAQRSTFLQFDDPKSRNLYVHSSRAGDTTYLDIQGINCGACAWLIERGLNAVNGVLEARVNSATGRARVLFDTTRTTLAGLLATVAALGYRPSPIAVGRAHTDQDREFRRHLTRLAVSGFGMMQVMMFAVALYTGEFQGMDAVMRTYMRFISLIVATPVMLYAGWPFYTAAWAALRARSLSMDVPVSLGLVLAYSASVANTITRSGDVYFDSVTMFIFFLTLARFIELIARRRSIDVTQSLSRLLPALAHRLGEGSAVEDVPVALLARGDEILIRNGEAVPADGTICSGIASVDESMLTGESRPRVRKTGDPVLAGSLNVGSPIYCRVNSVGGGTVLASIVALLLRAQTERPKTVRAADRMARKFLLRVLVGAALVFLLWHHLDPARAFGATLAVLVVACPCALSLAPLIALASAASALARQGVLISHPDALENMARATRVVFDKTGTLTSGRPGLTRVRAFFGRDERTCLEIAAALEMGLEHPLARAFRPFVTGMRVADVKVCPGAGVEGWIGGKRYRLGTRSFALDAEPESACDAADDGGIVLAEDNLRIAMFEVSDAVRPETASVMAALRKQRLVPEILSGDALERVKEVARSCGITQFAARCSPRRKLDHVRQLLAQGERVAMIGDGINDAPVLGAASVSIAMGHGSALAQASSDLVLVRDSLGVLPVVIAHARKTQRVVRQNMVWAAAYNFIAIPLAALGWVPPWAAAIGMSMSSILVVLNSLRVGSVSTSKSDEIQEPALIATGALG